MSSAPHKLGSSGGHALVSELKNGVSFEKVVLVHPSAKSSVEVFLHGATLTSWKILGQELLYLSPKAVFAQGKAIRGGVPIVFPQFGPGPLPQHGFARNSLWHLGATNVVQASGDISTEFILEDSPETRALWPHKFRLTLTVLLKPTSLSMQLRVQNLNDQAEEGSANKDASFPFTALLHTYLGVDDIGKTSVRGLQGKSYIDQLESDKSKQLKSQSDDLVRFDCGEVDAKYLDCNAAWVRDGGNCELAVRTTGFRDFVVWNPHIVKTVGMADMPADAWKHFVCVEAGTVQTPVELAAGKQWEGAQGISIAMMPETQQQVAERTLGQQKL